MLNQIAFRRRFILVTGLVALVFSAVSLARDTEPDDRAVLEGLSEVKVAFDITKSQPEKLLKILKLIEKTADSLVAQGVKPNFILAFRGPASFYVSSDRQLIKPEEHAVADEIAAQVKKMAGRDDVRFEQCSVAAKGRDIAYDTILPEVRVVGNTWISLMAYQHKGYGYILIQ